MTFEEAIGEMKELAGGDDWALMFEAASYHEPQIHGYIAREGVSHCKESTTYQGAIDNVKYKVQGPVASADYPPGFLEATP